MLLVQSLMFSSIRSSKTKFSGHEPRLGAAEPRRLATASETQHDNADEDEGPSKYRRLAW